MLFSPAGPRRWSLTTTGDDERLVIAARGELDVASGPDLRRALQQTGARRVLLDLRELTFADCAGIRGILEAAATMGDRLTILPASPAVHRVFTLLQLNDALPFGCRSKL